MSFSTLKKQWWPSSQPKGIWVLLFVFAVIFGLLSIGNHFNFRSYALDMGMFNQAAYAYAHGEDAWFTQGIGGEKVPYLCDHFSPALIIFAPLVYLFGSYALLIVQIAFVLLMMWSAWRIALLRGIGGGAALAIAAYCGGLWGVWAALSYDFHMNVVLACLLLPLFLFYELKRYLSLFLLTAFALLLKENAGFILSFFFGALMIRRGLRKEHWLVPVLTSVSLAFFLLVLFYLGPMQCDGHVSNSAKLYSAFGNSFSEAISNMLSSPIRMVSMLLYDGSGHWAKSKATSWWFLALSGGVLLLRYPIYIIMLLPVFAQKFLATDGVLWDVNRHYSIEFVPVLVLVLIEFTQAIGHRKYLQRVVLFIAVGMAFFMSWRGVISRSTQSNIFNPGHYVSQIDHAEFRELSSLVPPEAKLSVSGNLSPHLSFRETVYMFPDLLDADFVLLDKKMVYVFPYSADEMKSFIHDIRSNTAFEIVREKNQLVLFRRKY